jgi:hypothetical protein
MTARLVERTALHTALDVLLDGADTDGRIDTDRFWMFAALMAQGRGLTEGLHDAGLDALRTVPESPRATFAVRQVRAYHIALLARVLLDVGRLPGQGSILSANFQHGAVVHDLLGMVGGSGGIGEGDPQILNSGRQGEAGLRREARRRLVGVVRWRMGRTGVTRETVWNDLMGGGRNAEKSKIDRWQAEFGGGSGALCSAAFAAGKTGTRLNSWDATNEELADVIALVRTSPGRRTIDRD